MTLGTFINRLLAIVLMLGLSFGAKASDHGKEEKEFNTAEFALHHVQDSYGYHLWGEGEDAVTIPLPVILIGENGFTMFSSSEFGHGEKIVEKNGSKFAMYHGKIYELNKGESRIKLDHKTHEVKNAAKPLDFSITKNVLTLFVVAGLMLFIFLKVAKSYKTNSKAPTGLAGWMEPLIVFVRDDIAVPNIGNKYGKFMPYLLTVFFFIWIGNLLGLIPIIANPNLTGNISVTITLALITLIIQLMFANKAFWSHIFMPPGMPKILWVILIPIEFAGIFIKAGALMIRLFANITAGHIIVISLVSIIFVNKSIAWSGLSVPMTLFISALELLVAALQAYIFTMLSALFIGQAVQDDHH
jgi:F-type H+-transporting ATPase subunit a